MLVQGVLGRQHRSGVCWAEYSRGQDDAVLAKYVGQITVQEEELDVYPPDRVKRFKEEQRKVKVLFKDELMRLLTTPLTSDERSN